MSSLKAQVAEIAKMCQEVGWEVTQGGHHLIVRVPGNTRPISLPGSPGSQRSVTNLKAQFERVGLNELHAHRMAEKRQNARTEVARVQAKAAAAIDAANAAAANGKGAVSAVTFLADNGMRPPQFERITPAIAQQLLEAAETDPTFNQRPVVQRIVDAYADEMRTGQWRDFMPDGLICIDPQGVLLNGQKRMKAIIASGKTVGFIVARDVPRELFAYFDIAQPRTAADTFSIAGLQGGADMSSAVRLAMSYEAMLRGDEDPTLWKNWNKARVTNADALGFFQRRPGLAEYLQDARAIKYAVHGVVASTLVFSYYADKAWPQPKRGKNKRGIDLLEGFLHGIRDGERQLRTDPDKVLREWFTDVHADRQRIHPKRETYLFLLLRYWESYAKGSPVSSGRVHYSPTWPMPFPYHPDGRETAVRNALK